MATLIQSYEQQYSVVTADITAKIGRLKTGRNDESREQLNKEIQSNFEEANDLLEQLEIECRGAGAGSRVAAYRTELQRIRDEYRLAVNGASSNCAEAVPEAPAQGSSELQNLACTVVSDVRPKMQRDSHCFEKAVSSKPISIDMDDYDVGGPHEQHQKLLDNTERLERTGNKLGEGYRTLLETEQVGAAVLQDLHLQRETIQRSRGRLRETDEQLNRSTRLMNSMIVRSLQDRFVLIMVFFILGVLLCVGLYFYVS